MSEHLKKLLKTYDEAYYSGDPIVTDEEYDSIKSKYLKLTKKDEYDFVPGEKVEYGAKYQHSFYISSLDKVKITEKEKLREHIRTLMGDSGVVIEPKYDGLSIVNYPDGTCVTRGDGRVGDNVTANCQSILGLGQYLDEPFRAEILLPKSTFNRINKERIDEGLEPFKNPRNAAAGMLRTKGFNKIGLIAMAYDILGSTRKHSVDLDNMPDDLLVAHNERFTDVDEALNYILTVDKNKLEERYDLEIDGLVIRSDMENSLEIFGQTSHHPKDAIAVKFEAEEVWTKLNEIVYQVGRTGKITPVAEFEPVELMGSVISRATLHNEAFLEAMGLRIDPYKKEVRVTKANDIIPAILGSRIEQGVVHTGDIRILPTPCSCPACGGGLNMINDQLFCTNDLCIEKLVGGAVHATSKNGLDIVGLSEETLRKMFNVRGATVEVTTSYFFLDWTKEEIIEKLEGFADKSSEKLISELENKLKRVELNKFLYACAIPLVGKSVSRDIAKNFESIDGVIIDINKKDSKIATIEGIGPEILNSIRENAYKIGMLLTILENQYETEIINNLYREAPKNQDEQLTFVITGKLEKPRKYYQDLIEMAGHKVSGSVSKKTDYLICDGGSLNTSKAVKAIELGVPIIRVEELNGILGE